MAENKASSPDHDDHSPKPTMPGGTFKGIGTYQPLSKEATSVNQKTGHHGGGKGEA